MKTKYTLFRRGEVFYIPDSATGKQTSLKTKDETEARSLLNVRNEAQRQPVLNLHLARANLTASDPAFWERTWQTVMVQLQSRGKDSSRERCKGEPVARVWSMSHPTACRLVKDYITRAGIEGGLALPWPVWFKKHRLPFSKNGLATPGWKQLQFIWRFQEMRKEIWQSECGKLASKLAKQDFQKELNSRGCNARAIPARGQGVGCRYAGTRMKYNN